MKIELNPLLGKVKGKFGDFVFKQVNGKSYVARRPLPRSKSSFSDAERSKQKRFAMNTKLSSAINKIDVLRPLWHQAANGKMSSHNAISKANYPLVGYNELLIAPQLTPNSIGYDISTLTFNYNKGIISITFPPVTFGLVQDFNIDNRIMFAGVIYLRNPIEDGKEDFRFLSVKSDAVQVSEDNVIFLSLDLNDATQQFVESYSKATFFFCLISLDKNGYVVNTVSTFTESLFSNDN
ncbi:MAG: hypothetical protein ACOYN6_11440 [Ignavibacteria bacterium]